MSPEKAIRVGIVGSRRRNDFHDRQLLYNFLAKYVEKGYPIHLVSGGCPKGADRFAENIAEELGLGITVHKPDKRLLPAKPLYHDYVKMYHGRNTLIAEDCQILVALPSRDRKGGTEDTITKANALGRTIIIL